MSRYTFGRSGADYAVLPPSDHRRYLIAAPNVVGGTAWSARTGGVHYTDLVAVEGGAPITTDSNGYVNQFQGPDGITALWVDLGTGSRFQMRTVDGVVTSGSIDGGSP